MAACGRGQTSNIDAKALTIKKVADFSGDYSAFFPSSGFGNGDPFNVEWSAANAKVANGELALSIRKNAEGREYPYTGGEYRSKSFYGYGDFATRMKPSKTGGTASTFFTYTGEWDSEELHPSTGESDTRNPDNPEGKHDEIDIEFLGKDTTKVQFNYFTSGQGGHEFMYDLGFDASLEYHTYGFRWEKTQITWFVDDKPVYRVTDNIPTHPGRIISNFWCGSGRAEGWMGHYDDTNPTPDATYQWFSATGNAKETHKEPESSSSASSTPSSDWDAVAPIDFEVLAADSVYTTNVSADKKALDVTYTDVLPSSYANLTVNIPEKYRSSGMLRLEIENKGDAPVQVRADVNAATPHGPNNITAINTGATWNGSGVYTDMDWGGSKFDIGAGEKGTAIINFEGTPVNLLFMIDSAIYLDAAEKHAGAVSFSGYKMLVSENPSSSSSESSSAEPSSSSESSSQESSESSQESSSSEAYAFNFDFANQGPYTCVNDGAVSTITYESVDDNTYANVYSNIPGAPVGATQLAFEVTNNGAENVQFNIGVGKGGAEFVSYLVADSAYDWFDEGSKRAQYNVGPGASRTFTFALDASLGAVDGILVFINSCWAAETATHVNGNMTLANARLS
ncbi:MAG: family 16 glycosylhydrolase [Bacilli bacterium]|nr:family 16 glycosylhydrolase [Bacilli bacterium]